MSWMNRYYKRVGFRWFHWNGHVSWISDNTIHIASLLPKACSDYGWKKKFVYEAAQICLTTSKNIFLFTLSLAPTLPPYPKGLNAMMGMQVFLFFFFVFNCFSCCFSLSI
jgi:hypothetical protein